MNYLVVGLGNIGPEYAYTRHNMGFMVLDAWAQASNTVFTPGRYADVAEVPFRGHRFILVKPTTYMNLSGKAVRYWMQEKNVPIERTIVICDDLNIPFGAVRMRLDGSDGGHNGLKNIIELTSSQSFPRIRMGIGNDFSRGHQIDFVLGRLSEEELSTVKDLTGRIIEGLKIFGTMGGQRAMSAINAKPKADANPKADAAPKAGNAPTKTSGQ